LCREEAVELSSLLPRLQRDGVALYAVVHEDVGAEVQKFKSSFKGAVFLDSERRFYGPRERWMGFGGFLRPSVWMNIMRAKGKGVSGNMEGEGRLLGGVYVLGPGTQGILYEHREGEWGDIANMTNIEDALLTMNPAKKEN